MQSDRCIEHNRAVHWVHAALAQSQYKTVFCVIAHSHSHTHSIAHIPSECNRFDVTVKCGWKINGIIFCCILDERKADDEPARNLHQLSYLLRTCREKKCHSSENHFHSFAHFARVFVTLILWLKLQIHSNSNSWHECNTPIRNWLMCYVTRPNFA